MSIDVDGLASTTRATTIMTTITPIISTVTRIITDSTLTDATMAVPVVKWPTPPLPV